MSTHIPRYEEDHDDSLDIVFCRLSLDFGSQHITNLSHQDARCRNQLDYIAMPEEIITSRTISVQAMSLRESNTEPSRRGCGRSILEDERVLIKGPASDPCALQEMIASLCHIAEKRQLTACLGCGSRERTGTYNKQS